MTAGHSYRKRKAAAAIAAVLCLFLLTALLGAPFQASAASARASSKKTETWEFQTRRGNRYLEHDRVAEARKCYQTALRMLDRQGINDLRRAIVLNDLAEAYRAEDNKYEARMQELYASEIYQKEIENHLLGYEYAAKKPVEFTSGSLRPHCYVCHENWKVVPILYGKSNGYYNERVPSEDDAAYTHKPGGPVYCDQRWYCRDCRQSF